MLDIYGLFNLDNPDRIRYVGMTTKGAGERFHAHWVQARHAKNRRPVTQWLLKHGESNVGILILEQAEELEHLRMLERFWIAQYRDLGMADLNLADGGGGIYGYRHSEESRRRISESNRGRGERITDETRAKMSRSHARRMQRESAEERLARIDKAGKLTSSDAVEAKKMLWGGAPLEHIASKFGVSKSCISRIAVGKSLAHVPWPIGPAVDPRPNWKVPKRAAKLTEEYVREIRLLWDTHDVSKRALADAYGVSEAAIRLVILRESWKHVE